MTDVIIRPMDPGDYEAVRELWMSIRGFGIRALDDSRDDVVRFIQRNPTTSVVAVCGDRIVGSILCGSDGRQGAMYHVCVAEDFRRKGIGTKMVSRCMEELRKMGINKISLIAFKSNDAGNAFWNGIGWTRSDVNCYEYLLNKENTTEFIGA